MEIINYCDQHKILLALFPPHSTHAVQPPDVVVFKSFSSSYTKELISFQSKSQDILPLVKSDFFNLFWGAWNLAFNKVLILKASECLRCNKTD